jgi:hypothetical protein
MPHGSVLEAMAKLRNTANGKRRCSRCKKLKPRDEFPRNAATADGIGLYCRPCKRDSDRARRNPGATAQPPQRPAPEESGAPQNPAPRQRAPALAISDELIDKACDLIRRFGVTRRAAARHVGVSENTFKNWLREGADQKDASDPRARLLFEVEMAEGDAERELTEAYFHGAKMDPQVAQRFLERRFSKGDEKWARTEHLTVSDGDAAPMEIADARKLLADKLDKLLGAARGGPGNAGGDAGRAAGGDGSAPAAAGQGDAATGDSAAEPGAAAGASQQPQ